MIVKDFIATNVSKSDNKKISIIFSFRNEQIVIPELVERVVKSLATVTNNYEIIFVNDASTDESLSIILKEREKNKNIKAINMSARFGVANCILAGIRNSTGDAIIFMDADLQDPPELLAQMINKYFEGYDVVNTKRILRKGESKIKIFVTQIAYLIIKIFSGNKIPTDAGDFKLISRRVAIELLKFNEQNIYLRGIIPNLGFKQTTIFYNREKRTFGKSHFPLWKDFGTFNGPIGTFFCGLISISFLPIFLWFFVGMFLFLTSIAFLFFSFYNKKNISVEVLLSFYFGLQIFIFGIIGIYIAKIYDEVRNRPRYVIESMIGFDEKK